MSAGDIVYGTVEVELTIPISDVDVIGVAERTVDARFNIQYKVVV